MIRTYTYGLNRISEDQLIGSSWMPSFYGYDGHPNVRFQVNTAGTVTDTYQFDAFGNQISISGSTANSYLFSTEQFDANLSLYYQRARYYLPQTGRFLTMDPYEGSVLRPLSFQGYACTLNSPINSIAMSHRVYVPSNRQNRNAFNRCDSF